MAVVVNGKSLVMTEGWVWCLHCECVHTRARWDRHSGNCPTQGCDGFIVGDGWPWEEIRKGREDRYPAFPVDGGVYQLYE